MPNSIMSRISHTTNNPRSSMAADAARDIADREIRLRIQSGYFGEYHNEVEFNEAVKKEYQAIYHAQYYKYYKRFVQSDQPNVTVYYVEHPSTRKYTKRHTPVNFSKSNCLIYVRDGCIKVCNFKYPLDKDESIETKEAFLSSWPGPLDQMADDFKRRVTVYLGELLLHAPRKRIHYTNPTNDEHRKTILKLLAELLANNGIIHADGVTRLLLQPEQIETQKDDHPVETLQKYLLLGKRREAAKCAKSERLLDHATCLTLLDRYQPPNTMKDKDAIRLRDDSVVQLIDEIINSLDPNSIIHLVYRSLLNRVLQSDPESLDAVKRANVENKNYEFAILSANDCDMDFDQSNEIFKLITAFKNINLKPQRTIENHLIQLGFTSVDGTDSCADMSSRSSVTYDTQQDETPSSRTLTISSIDMMVLNEIWEYCQNLACNTCDSSSYQYMINLVPYKLVFASRLLDYGLLDMFAQYINSITYALSKAEESERDPYYDWDTIKKSVEYLSGIYENFIYNPSILTSLDIIPLLPQSPLEPTADASCPPPTGYDGLPQPLYPSYNDPRNPASSLDYTDSSRYYTEYSVGGPSSNQFNHSHASRHNRTIPPQEQVIPPQSVPLTYQPPIPEETTDFNPEPEPQQLDGYDRHQEQKVSAATNDYSNETSRRTSLDASVQPAQRQQAYPYPPEPEHITTRTMTSSSPVQKNHDSSRPSQPLMSDSFSVLSPINPSDTNQVQPPLTHPNNVPSSSWNNTSSANEAMNSPSSGITSQNYNSNNNTNSSMNTNNNNINNQRTAGKEPSKTNTSQRANSENRPGLLTNVLGGVGALFPNLPRTNSKKMILPDDSDPSIQYDEAKGAWVDKSNPDGVADIVNEPPPMMPAQKVPCYSFNAHVKSAKTRYPKSQIGP